jgi:hypothetical protein
MYDKKKRSIQLTNRTERVGIGTAESVQLKKKEAEVERKTCS